MSPARVRASVSLPSRLTSVPFSVSSLSELQRTPEFAEYETANENGSRACLDVQTKLDERAAEPRFEGTWIPDLRLTMQAVLGCSDIVAD